MSDSNADRSGGDASKHSAAEGRSLGKMGAPPDTIAWGDQRGPGLESTTRRPSIRNADQDTYWRKEFAQRDYTDVDRGYEYYRPAYRYGWEARRRQDAGTFDAVEEDLRVQWQERRSRDEPDWEEARPAIRDAWRRAGGATGETGPGNPLS